MGAEIGKLPAMIERTRPIVGLSQASPAGRAKVTFDRLKQE